MTWAWQKERRWNRRSETQGIQDTWAGNLSPGERENLIPGESGRTGVSPGMSRAQVRGTSQRAAKTVGWGFTSIGLTGEPGWWLVQMCNTPHLSTVHPIAVWDGWDMLSSGFSRKKRGFSVHTAGLRNLLVFNACPFLCYLCLAVEQSVKWKECEVFPGSDRVCVFVWTCTCIFMKTCLSQDTEWGLFVWCSLLQRAV